MIISAFVFSLLGCSTPPPPPSATPEGRLCGRAYSSTIDSLEEMFNKAGKDLPEVLTKKDYVEKCVGMGFSEEQLKCLDPKLANGNKKCDAALKDVKDKQKKLAEQLMKKSDKPKKPEAKPDAKPADKPK